MRPRYLDRLGEALAGAVGPHLGRQRWFAGPAPGAARLERVERLDAGPPGLAWAEVSVPDGGEAERRRYQLVLALRPEGDGPDVPPDAVLGRFDTAAGPVRVADALSDPEASLSLLRLAAPGERAARARPLGVEQTNSSVVYDDRLLLKLYRRLVRGPNPEAEVTAALAAVGSASVVPPVAVWRRDGHDLAVVQPYLNGGEEGWALALASWRARPNPGSFASEARELGEVTAELHAGLARAFGTSEGDPAAWADAMTASLEGLAPEDRAVAAGAEEVFARLRALVPGRAGRALRVHGDYHLGQVMRTAEGWRVLDFEGEPGRPLDERRLASSPLKDVAGMLRSFSYAAEVNAAGTALVSRCVRGHEGAAARGWEEASRGQFLRGYLGASGVGPLLPGDDAALVAVLDAFELDKAVYELGYERAHRPAWAHIPLAAVARLTAS